MNEQEALIHGGGVKVGRCHMSIVRLRQARRDKDWREVYYCLEDLFMEVEAYLYDKERASIMPVWQKMTNYMDIINRGRSVESMMGESLLMELKVRRVLKRLKLDMDMKPTEQHLSGAIT